MKKTLVMVFGALLLVSLTGCGNKNQIKCTAEQTQSGITMKSEVTAELDSNDKIKSVSAAIDFGSKEMASAMCTMYNSAPEEGLSVSCDGSKMKINDFEKYVSADSDSEAKIVGISKDEFKKGMESQGYTCK